MANRKNGMRRYEGMHEIVPGLFLSGMSMLQAHATLCMTSFGSWRRARRENALLWTTPETLPWNASPTRMLTQRMHAAPQLPAMGAAAHQCSSLRVRAWSGASA